MRVNWERANSDLPKLSRTMRNLPLGWNYLKTPRLNIKLENKGENDRN